VNATHFTGGCFRKRSVAGAGGRVLSGDASGVVVVWDCLGSKTQLLPTYRMSAACIAPTAPLQCGIRALHLRGNSLLIGTAGSEIFEVCLRLFYNAQVLCTISMSIWLCNPQV
jgi:hypothetical protein